MRWRWPQKFKCASLALTGHDSDRAIARWQIFDPIRLQDAQQASSRSSLQQQQQQQQQQQRKP